MMRKPSQKRKEDYFRQLLYFHEHPSCQICGSKAMDVHHIIYKSEGGKAEEDNLISLCREDHNRAHFKGKPYLSKDELWNMKGLDLVDMGEKYRLIRLGAKR